MNWVDGVVLAVLLLAAFHGRSVGALTQVLTFGGFALGVTFGALLADAVVPHVHDPTEKALVAVALVLAAGAACGAVGRVVGEWSRSGVRRVHLGALDRAAGVGVAVVATLFALWFVASELVLAPAPWLSSGIQGSRAVRAVDSVLPPLPTVFSHVQGLLGAPGFPSAFSELEPVPLRARRPSHAAAAEIARAARASTVKVVGQACGYLQEGSAFVVAPGTLVTNAHVVAGEAATSVVVGTLAYRATVVSFDPTYDLAVLRTTAPLGPPLELAASALPRGTQGAVVGYPGGGSLTVSAAAIASDMDARGRNIYGEGLVSRRVYEIDADVEPGSSGGPFVTASGEVAGVVFSRSTAYRGVAYALASPGVLAHLRVALARARRAGAASDQGSRTGACTESG